jgi:Sporulation factor SpoIIGA.
MIIYIDILLIENFIINLFLLMVMTKLLKVKKRRKQEIFAATLGAFYVLVMISPSLRFFTLIPFKLIVSVIMVYIAIGTTNFRNLFKGTVVLIMLSFLLSGMCFGLSFFSNGYSLDSGYTVNSFPIKYLVLAILCILIFTERVVDIIKDKYFVSNYTYDVTIKINNHEIHTKGFLDTGNELKEPITNLPVIIIEKTLYDDVDLDPKKLLFINFKAVNGIDGMLRGIRAKEIIIENENCKLIREGIVCFTEHSLAEDGEYKALLSRGIV